MLNLTGKPCCKLCCKQCWKGKVPQNSQPLLTHWGQPDWVDIADTTVWRCREHQDAAWTFWRINVSQQSSTASFANTKWFRKPCRKWCFFQPNWTEIGEIGEIGDCSVAPSCGTVISILVRFKLRKQRCFASRRKSVHSSVWLCPVAAAFVSLLIISYFFSPYGSHQVHFALQAAAILDVHVSIEGLGQERPEAQHKL